MGTAEENLSVNNIGTPEVSGSKVEGYYQLLQAQNEDNPDADGETLTRAAEILAEVFEPLTSNDGLTGVEFHVEGKACGLPFKVEQIGKG